MQKLTVILTEYQVPAHLIILEIPEGLALENLDELNKKISQLQELGFPYFTG